MKNTLVLFVSCLSIFLFSCKKGECTCTVFGGDVSSEVTADSHSEYKENKSNCESAGCEWKAKL